MPSPLPRPLSKRLCTTACPYVYYPKSLWESQPASLLFTPFPWRLWNSLPVCEFNPSYDFKLHCSGTRDRRSHGKETRAVGTQTERQKSALRSLQGHIEIEVRLRKAFFVNYYNKHRLPRWGNSRHVDMLASRRTKTDTAVEEERQQ